MNSTVSTKSFIPGVSVIICCYNSKKRLPETLRHLSLQRVRSDVPWEILIIDNASTDETSAVAARLVQEYGLAEKTFILKEGTPGKNFAFELGINTAQYEFILTCDDDNWLSESYIQTAFDLLTADEQVGALGGNGIFEPEHPVNQEIIPYKGSYVNGPQNNAAGQHYVYGAGSLYRKSLFTALKKMNWQQVTTGRLGSKLISGEDVEICFAIYLLGYKIIADNRLEFKHFVPLKRQTMQYLLNMKYWSAYSNVLLNSYFFILNKEKRSLSKVLGQWFFGMCKTMLKHYVTNFFKRLRQPQPPSIEAQFAIESNKGTFAALLKKRHEVADHHAHLLKIFGNQLQVK